MLCQKTDIHIRQESPEQNTKTIGQWELTGIEPSAVLSHLYILDVVGQSWKVNYTYVVELQLSIPLYKAKRGIGMTFSFGTFRYTFWLQML